ncbi:putative transport system permease protein [Staphylococcus aureus]|uniref:Putative transport system permease protein n=1 Tax=Staphylococcus aureus TaxID=1280 RepID=A0A8G2HXN1_STAAU|nr:putative transport system permease protein [Staphylococcus aureus]
MYVQKNNKMFYALLIAITVQSIGLLILKATGILQISAHSFPILGTVIGSFYFWNWNSIGWRMCNRYLYRAGEGLIGSWIALVLYAVTAAITKTGILKPVMDKINQPTNVNSDMSQTTAFRFWD